DNKTSSLKRIRLSLNSLLYHFGIDEDFSISMANMKDIPYTLLYTTSIFLVINRKKINKKFINKLNKLLPKFFKFKTLRYSINNT
ncbi:hypothetical protein H8356DRAFT_935315, partial [Neocallimastix lanati (nom. inval.)]